MTTLAEGGMLDIDDARITWRGVDWPQIFLFVFLWEMVYQISRRCCQQSDHPKIREQGASYGAALVNALVCSVIHNAQEQVRPLAPVHTQSRSIAISCIGTPLFC